MHKSGEGTSAEWVVKKQISEFPEQLCLYESAILEQRVEHRLAAYVLMQPEVVVFGSSRANNFRSSHFLVPFMSMSRAVNSTSSLLSVSKNVINIHKPQLAIVLIDPWWFLADTKKSNEQAIALGNEIQEQPAQNAVFNDMAFSNSSSLFDSVKLPFQWLRDEKVSFKEYMSLIVRGRLSKESGDCFIGISAHKRHRGYAIDGSRYDFGLLNGTNKSEDIQFKDTLDRLRQRRSLFDVQKPLQEIRFKEFKDFVALMNNENIQVLSVFPPLAPTVYGSFAQASDIVSRHQKIVNRVSALTTVFDYTNPALLNTSDCEFIDGFHPGEVTNVRMLDSLSKNHDGELLLASLDKKAIKQIMRSSVGRVYALNSQTKGEIDFLGLGCAK